MTYAVLILKGLQYGLLLSTAALLGVVIALYLSTPFSQHPMAGVENYPNLQNLPTMSNPSFPRANIFLEETIPIEEPTETIAREKIPSLLQENDSAIYTAAVNETLTIEPQFPTEGIFAPINERTRSAMVNIFCTRKSGPVTRTISGSGIIIDPRGVILTNAHVAELFLLEGRTVAGVTDCRVRTGNPARDAYDAELLYMPEEWIREFAPTLSATEALGTGESDFALLLITRTSHTGDELLEPFPYIPFNVQRGVAQGEDHVLIAGYPALVETLNGIRKNLYLVSTLATVEELFTFDRAVLDLFAVGGTIASQEGASGGAAVSRAGELIGVIVTSTQASSALDRELRVLSLEHIDRKIAAETGATLTNYLAGNLKEMQRAFQRNRTPLLTSLVLKQFED